ncbi:uncharacterized protein LOC142978746 [Anticarsia gemmatalis]|uniref:uncharacterized protein LOC142978746 n=1 Tax=Anticarsia gemmatalis TaxID=129554 RepID=UPI003F76CA4D
MKLIFVLTAVLALAFAEEDKAQIESIEDSVAAEANIELLKEGADLKASETSYPYIPPSQRPPQWQVPQNTNPQVQHDQPPSGAQNDYYFIYGNTPSHEHHHNYPPQPQPQPHPHPPTTTTPVPVIKNEQYIGDNGYYRYEYQIADGTHVSEEGFYLNGKKDEDSLVKRGWYSFKGADGKIYTTTYWADKTGYHAYGAHLPTAEPAPAPTKPVQETTWVHHDEVPASKPVYPPVTTFPNKPVQPPKPVYPTKEPVPTYPNVPSYVPSHNVPQVPSHNVPQVPSHHVPQVPSYNQPQIPSYNQPQIPSYQPQQYYPQQPTNYVPYNHNV